MLKKRSGFTLIELLIVIVIIGILAAIAIPMFSKTREKAMVKAMTSDLRNMATQQELYFSAPQNSYTYGVLTDLVPNFFSPSNGVTLTVNGGASTGWSASATHTGLPGVTCAIFIGSAAALAPATTAGIVTCNDTN
ncbi:MAG: prepilin-type N-terminal cleavage/methylation domain-containing protein [Gemmatimonadetes bacterium]|nr:prepilin-type N-terminal cleavage/methylation domain-containing protein [Gemmatimonadota bacterium]